MAKDTPRRSTATGRYDQPLGQTGKFGNGRSEPAVQIQTAYFVHDRPDSHQGRQCLYTAVNDLFTGSMLGYGEVLSLSPSGCNPLPRYPCLLPVINQTNDMFESGSGR